MPKPPVPHRSPLRALSAALALLTALAAGPAWAAERLILTYRVHVGGVAVVDGQASLGLAGGRYTVRVEAVTDGFVGWLAPFQARAESAGAVTPDGLRPERHRTANLWRGKERTVAIDYRPEGPNAAVHPDAESDDRDPVPPELQAGTLDPLSAFAALAHATAAGGACTATVPVFDGRRRYDLMFGDAGERTLEPSRYSAFSGKARLCRVSHRSIAGMWRNPQASRWNRPDGQRPPVDVYLGTVRPGAPPVPVRVEADSPIGGVLIHLVRVETAPDTAARP